METMVRVRGAEVLKKSLRIAERLLPTRYRLSFPGS